MKIIFGTSSKLVSDHAQKLVRAIDDVSLKHPSTVQPKGVAIHAAHFPTVCSDCGETYWHAGDQYDYPPHIPCTKGKKKTGFS